MKNSQEIKDAVKEKYGEIALQSKAANQASCCGAGSCSTEVYNIMMDDYSALAGYAPDADLGLGCGIPTQFAEIKKGDTVIDLGSGAGNDCFIARHEAGEDGRVIGIDMTPAMIDKARANAEKLGYSNVEFRLGDLEKMPVSDDMADVIVSNCVLNLVPDKHTVFKEIFRVLKAGGHFSISDIVLVGDLPESLRESAEMYAGCVAGAMQKDEYLEAISAAGFSGVTIQKERAIEIPDDILEKYLSAEALADLKKGTVGIVSITVYGEKARTCCVAEACC